MAQRDYDCQGCRAGIHPGEEYEGHVMVCGKRLWVSRWHHPCCPWDPEEEDEQRKMDEKIEQQERKEAQNHSSAQRRAA